jgi:hypothetical protein
MRTILVIFVFLFVISAEANDLVWHKGSVVLDTKEVVVGDLARQGFDLLLLRDSQGAVSVYPAHKISSFRYYDEAENINRAFIVIANRHYERVASGRISVFRIQKLFDQKMNEKNADAYEYFVEEEKVVHSIKSFRKKYFDKIKEELDLRLVRYEHLDPNTKHGALSLILLYNQSLFESGSI